MAWTALTEADVLTQMSGPELAAIRAAALKGGQVDPLQPTLDQVTRYVRGRVAACRNNTLGPAGMIPDELKYYALALFVRDFIARPAGIKIDAGYRKDAWDRAEKVLVDVANCDLVIEEPTIASVEKSSFPTPKFASRNAAFGKEFEDGI